MPSMQTRWGSLATLIWSDIMLIYFTLKLRILNHTFPQLWLINNGNENCSRCNIKLPKFKKPGPIERYWYILNDIYRNVCYLHGFVINLIFYYKTEHNNGKMSD
jgi:hypothetical protein